MKNMPLFAWNLLAAGMLAVVPEVWTADASIKEDFDSYDIGMSVKAGQTDFGEAVAGWLSPWRASIGHAATVATVAADQPLNAGGRYVSTVVSTTPGRSIDEGTGGSLARAYDAAAVSSAGTKPYAVTFDFRADQAPEGLRFSLSDCGQRGAFFDSTATWVLCAYNGRWHVGNRLAFADAGVPFRAGVVYRIAVETDPSSNTWGVSISSEAGSASLENLACRAPAWATDSALPDARWLIFSASEMLSEGGVSAGDISTAFSVDSIEIGKP